jgi:hypothetical protein
VGHNFTADHYLNYDNAPNNTGCTQYKSVMNIVANPPAGTCKVNWFGAGPVGDVGTTDYLLANCNPASCPRSAPYVDQH